MDRPDPHSYTPVGEQTRLIFGAGVANISVDEVYEAAHEMLSTNRTDMLSRGLHG
jgi:hypothetical protein